MWRKQYLYVKKILCVQVEGTQLLLLGLSLLLHVFLIFSISAGNFIQTGQPLLSSPFHLEQIAEVDLTMSLVGKDVEIDESSEVLATDQGEKRESPPSQLLPVADSTESSSISKLVTPYYFSASALSVKPVVIRDISVNLKLQAPGVPAQAAILRMQINEYGDVDQVVVEDSLLEEITLNIIKDEFSKLQFIPGEIDGVPVKSELKIEVMLE